MKTQNIQRLYRIRNTLLFSGTPAAKYLADDLSEILNSEADMPGTGLTSDEIERLKQGYVIPVIKDLRSRKMGADGRLFGLREAKEMVENAASTLGLYMNGKWLIEWKS